jgi:predicted 3-demethylubiquinone-9 3-methyltransferase (glyoxalase superfamily)
MATTPSQKIRTFLIFEDRAEEAMTFYLPLFGDAEIVSMTRYGDETPGAKGTVQHTTFTLAEQQSMCINSPLHHEFTSTPAVSLHV